MKRDMGLIQDLMERMERTSNKHVSFKDDAIIEYHLRLLKDNGLVDVKGAFNAPDGAHVRLTWNGHEFLERLQESEKPPAVPDESVIASELYIDQTNNFF